MYFITVYDSIVAKIRFTISKSFPSFSVYDLYKIR